MTADLRASVSDVVHLPEVDPTEVGLDPGRLAQLDRHLEGYVERELLAGWSLAVVRDGRLAHRSAAGHRDREAGVDVGDDTIWRIYSMTKPITSVAALRLWERGEFELTDPVSRFLPAFGDLQVWRTGSVLRPTLEPVAEPMRMWHLFTHTAGLTYGFMYAHPVDEMYRRAGFDPAAPVGRDLTAQVDAIAELPLLFQPGTEWAYSMATDVLGRVIEIITGTSLDVALADLVLDPLGMVETGFSVREVDADRLAAMYVPGPGTRRATRLAAFDDPASRTPVALSGGGGLYSTMSDYLRFAEMLRRGGALDGVRLLSPRTVERMAANHLPGNADLTTFGRPLIDPHTFDGVGFGLGVAVTVDPVASHTGGSVGDHGWDGAASTTYWVDPAEDLAVVFLTQLMPITTHPLRSQLRQLVYQALVD